MNQYGTGQNLPYADQQDADLVNNPRYTGQSVGTNGLGRDGRGPAEESRYGSMPVSTTGTTPPSGQAQPGLGGQNTSAGVWPTPAAPPHARRSDFAGEDEYGNPRREGVVDRMKDAVGVGPNSGATGYDARRDEPGYGTAGYDNYGQPRREGTVDKMQDAVGMGPRSGAYTNDATRGPYTGQDYTNVNRPGDERGFHGGLGHPHGTTMGTTGYDQSGVGSGLGTGYDQSGVGSGLGTGYDQSGVGSGLGTGYDQSGVGSGMGIGHHHNGIRVVPGNIPVADLGERRVEPGYDASRGQFGHHNQGTLTGSPRKEGIVGKIKDAVGIGKHDNVAQTYPGTTTGTILPNTYGTGDTGLLNHDTSSTTPGYSHNQMVETGLGHGRHPGSNTGYPHETVGQRVEDVVGVGQHGAAGYPHNTSSAYPGPTTGYPNETAGQRVEDAVGVGHHGAAGYPGSTGYPHETVGQRAEDVVGLGPHHGVAGTDNVYERRGKGFEDTSGEMYDTNTGPGHDGIRTGTGYDETNVDNLQNDANAYGVDSAPPKKGIMTKLKEKLHH